MKAVCQCGALSAETVDSPHVAVACHCTACQRRTGSPFGLLVYVPAEGVTVHGDYRTYRRTADSGASFESAFCPTCGSSVFATASKHPMLTGLAAGAIADPALPAPIRSVWETTRHHWVKMPVETARFERGVSG